LGTAEGRDIPATAKAGELSTPEDVSDKLRSISSWGSLLGALRVRGSSNSEAHRLRDWSDTLRRSVTSIGDRVEVIIAEGGKLRDVCSGMGNPGECRGGGYDGAQ